MKFKAYSLIFLVIIVVFAFLLYNNEIGGANNNQQENKLEDANTNKQENNLEETNDSQKENKLDDVSNNQEEKELGNANNCLQESDLPIKITPINSFYNNDYYGEMLNYQIESVERDGDKRYVVNYNVEYPNLYKIKNMSVLQEVNEQLKMVPFIEVLIDDYNQVLNEFSSIINKEHERVKAAKGSCKIYLFDDDYISLGYKCDYVFGPRTTTKNRLLTVDLRTGKSVDVQDFVNIDSIIKNIQDLKFDIIEGSYTCGFGTGKDPDRISSFIEEIKLSVRQEVIAFSVDKSDLYLNFPYRDSLNGYMLLKFNLDDLKQ